MARPISTGANDDTPETLSDTDLSNAIVRGLPFALVLVAPGGVVQMVNPLAEECFGLSARRMVGGVAAQVFANSPQLIAAIETATSRNISVTEPDAQIHTPLGHVVSTGFEVSSTEAGGALVLVRPEGMASRQVDALLSGRQMGEGAASMAAVLAHEVKNPLLGIRGAAQLLEESVATAGDKNLATLIQGECDRITALLDRMDALSNPAPETLSPLNVHAVLDHALGVAKSGFARDVEIIQDFDPSLPPVMAEEALLAQVVLTLLKNAVEANGEANDAGGKLVIRTAYALDGVMRDEGGTERRVPIIIEVSDEGAGIAPEIMPQLFRPFATTKRMGHGLGLALAAKFARDMGGLLDGKNQPEGGAVFTLRLGVGEGGAE